METMRRVPSRSVTLRSPWTSAAVWNVDRDGTVLKDDVVGAALGFENRARLHGAAFEVDGGTLRAQMEADGVQSEPLFEHRREHVLAGMLLHVIEAAAPIDGALDHRAIERRGRGGGRCAPLSSTTSSTGTPAMAPVSQGWPPEAG